MSRKCRLVQRAKHALGRLCRGQIRLRVSVAGDGFWFGNVLFDEETVMASSLRDGKRLKIKFSAVDRDGFPVSLPAPAAFTVSDTSLAAVIPGDADSAFVVPVQPFKLGTVKVTGSVPDHPELGTLEYTVNLVASDASKLVGAVEVVDDAPAPEPPPATVSADPKAPPA